MHMYRKMQWEPCGSRFKMEVRVPRLNDSSFASLEVVGSSREELQSAIESKIAESFGYVAHVTLVDLEI